MTAFKESRYLLDLTSLQVGKALTFHKLPMPTLAFLREVNNSSFEATSKTTSRKWFFSARKKESLVACGLLAAAPPETELREILAIPTPKLIAEVRKFEPKFTKAWLTRGTLMIKLLEKLCSIDIQKDVEAALLAFHDAYERSVVCASLPAVDLLEILHRQPRGWFFPAMVRRKMYENINGFTSNDTFTVPVEFVEQQLLEMHKGKQLSVKGARQKERVYTRAWETFAYSHVAAILEELVNAIVGPEVPFNI